MPSSVRVVMHHNDTSGTSKCTLGGALEILWRLGGHIVESVILIVAPLSIVFVITPAIEARIIQLVRFQIGLFYVLKIAQRLWLRHMISSPFTDLSQLHTIMNFLSMLHRSGYLMILHDNVQTAFCLGGIFNESTISFVATVAIYIVPLASLLTTRQFRIYALAGRDRLWQAIVSVQTRQIQVRTRLRSIFGNRRHFACFSP